MKKCLLQTLKLWIFQMIRNMDSMIWILESSLIPTSGQDFQVQDNRLMKIVVQIIAKITQKNSSQAWYLHPRASTTEQSRSKSTKI